jgi:hypothetical protein
LTARQRAEWRAYYRIEPFGTEFHELLHGIMTAAIVNANGAKPPVRPKDYMPNYEEPEMSAEEIFAAWRGE